MRKFINGELIQAVIRKAADGQNFAFVGAVVDQEPTHHVIVIQEKDTLAVANALREAGVEWQCVEVKQSDFYESREV